MLSWTSSPMIDAHDTSSLSLSSSRASQKCRTFPPVVAASWLRRCWIRRSGGLIGASICMCVSFCDTRYTASVTNLTRSTYFTCIDPHKCMCRPAVSLSHLERAHSLSNAFARAFGVLDHHITTQYTLHTVTVTVPYAFSDRWRWGELCERRRPTEASPSPYSCNTFTRLACVYLTMPPATKLAWIPPLRPCVQSVVHSDVHISCTQSMILSDARICDTFMRGIENKNSHMKAAVEPRFRVWCTTLAHTYRITYDTLSRTA